MQFTLHDGTRYPIAFIDDESPESLNFLSGTFDQYLEEASYTVTLTVAKNDDRWRKVVNGNWLSFNWRNKTKIVQIIKVTETEDELEVYCESCNMVLMNTQLPPYEGQPAKAFASHILNSEYNYLNAAGVAFGYNEVAGIQRQVEYTDASDSAMKRFLKLAASFDAELDFVPTFSVKGQFTGLRMDVYKEQDDDNQGVGKDRTDIILDITNVSDIKRTVSLEDYYNEIAPYYRDKETQQRVYMNRTNQQTYEDGIYVDGNTLKNPKSAEQYPGSNVGTGTQWIRRDIEIQTDNREKLQSEGLKLLRANSYPKETIEVSGTFDLDLGDKVKLQYPDMTEDGVLIVTMRVVKMSYDFKTGIGKCTFSNFKRLKSAISSALSYAGHENAIAANPVYNLDAVASDGILLSDAVPQTTIRAVLSRDGEEITASDVGIESLQIVREGAGSEEKATFGPSVTVTLDRAKALGGIVYLTARAVLTNGQVLNRSIIVQVSGMQTTVGLQNAINTVRQEQDSNVLALTQAIQSLQAQNEALQAQINALRG